MQEATIVARYRAFWDARLAANANPPNPDDPALAEYATGAQLAQVVAETKQRRDQGLALRLPSPSRSNHEVRVVSTAGDEATLQDCAVNDGIVYRPATGEVVDDSVVTRSVEATMQLVDGEWRLANTRVVQQWKGVAGCALARDDS